MTESVILLTGFEPFGGEAINPSWEVARQLDGERIGEARVASQLLPCCFGQASDVLQAAIAQHRPGWVLALGQAAGRLDFSIERVAINVDDARIADNAEARPIDQAVVADGPAAYFSTLPIKAIVSGLRARGLPSSVSNSAGTFVCNHVFYALMHALRDAAGVRAGFMHLPLLPEQAARMAGQASMPLDTMVNGVREVLHIAVLHRGEDLALSDGRIS